MHDGPTRAWLAGAVGAQLPLQRYQDARKRKVRPASSNGRACTCAQLAFGFRHLLTPTPPRRSAGQKQEFEGETYTVEELTEKRYVHAVMLFSAIDQPSLFNTCLLISIEGAARQCS